MIARGGEGSALRPRFRLQRGGAVDVARDRLAVLLVDASLALHEASFEVERRSVRALMGAVELGLASVSCAIKSTGPPG